MDNVRGQQVDHGRTPDGELVALGSAEPEPRTRPVPAGPTRYCTATDFAIASCYPGAPCVVRTRWAVDLGRRGDTSWGPPVRSTPPTFRAVRGFLFGRSGRSDPARLDLSLEHPDIG